MRRTVKHIFSTKETISDITGRLSDCDIPKLSYAKAEKTMFSEGTMYSQYFSHYLFLLEHISIDLHSDLEAEFTNEKKRLFLFALLDGSISLFAEDGFPIIKTEKNIFFATYNKKGNFRYQIPKGNHQFLCVTPRTAWLKRNKEYFPRIIQFIDSMKSERKLFSHMSPCLIDKHLRGLLLHLFNIRNIDPTELEINIFRKIKAIIGYYQLLLDEKFSRKSYIIKDYIDNNYCDINLTNKALTNKFFTTEKTLIHTFKREFGITPHSYIIKKRMEKAKSLIISDKILPSEIYLHIGYSDFHSFRKQFKKHFGIPPSQLH
ncbi:AraC family transcriptional regulator [Sphingobacterium sp.]|uniref:AraC family transcriptional regulator n=1 Tax=Sphingobacterium sp. TaxID=341027 RepID=UPI0031D4893B